MGTLYLGSSMHGSADAMLSADDGDRVVEKLLHFFCEMLGLEMRLGFFYSEQPPYSFAAFIDVEEKAMLQFYIQHRELWGATQKAEKHALDDPWLSI